MIVRILGEGQYDVSDAALERLNALDGELETAVAAGDEPAFRAALAALVDGIRTAGVPRDAESLQSSDVIVPPADASMDEVRDLLDDDGLIPG